MDGTKKKEKQPYFIALKDGKSSVFDVLWERWHDEKARKDIEAYKYEGLRDISPDELIGYLRE